MRFRITVRGLGVELRGRFDQLTDEDAPTLADFADAMEPFGMVVASPASDDSDSFGITEPENPPSLEKSRDIIGAMMENASNPADLLDMLATIHCGQAVVIRGERYQREKAEAELRDRELHHFETEERLAKVKGIVEAEIGWETPALLRDTIQGAIA
jgi:hypothetical protein